MIREFYKNKVAEIEKLIALSQNMKLPLPWAGDRPNFSKSIYESQKENKIAIIFEYQRASLLEENFQSSLNLDELGSLALKAQAKAISVFTEETRFKGSLDDLEKIYQSANGKLPIIRNDFIYHPFQVLASASTPSSAVILNSILFQEYVQLKELREHTEQYGMEAIVEVLEEQDLEFARKTGAKIILVNSFNYGTLNVNKDASLKLAEKFKGTVTKSELWILSGGVKTEDDLKAAQDVGFEAVIVGENFLKQNK